MPPILNIVLYQPEIPGNTGAVGRTCVALGANLWLVRHLGFRIDEKPLRRAGLDYWQHLEWEVANHWEDLMDRLQPEGVWFFTKFSDQGYDSVSYELGDTLVFGCETNGLPKSLTAATPERNLRIRTTGKVRSLNLACSVGVAAYEATRQFAADGRITMN